MTSIYYQLIIFWLSMLGCECQNSLTPSLSINMNNEPFSLQNNSWIDTLATNSYFNPELVQDLTSLLTTTSYNVIQESLSSMDYLSLVKPTMSSAYTRITNDTESTENVHMKSFLESNLPLSIISANHFSKHSNDFQVLESSVGISSNFLTDDSDYGQSTMDNYMELSSFVTPSNNPSSLLQNLRILSTKVEESSETILTAQFDSITHSSDLPVSSLPLSEDFNAFRANSFGTKLTNFKTHRELQPSEWRADIFPSVAYDQALFSAFSNSFELDYDVYDSEVYSLQPFQKSEISSSKLDTEVSNQIQLESSQVQTLQGFSESSLDSLPNINPTSVLSEDTQASDMISEANEMDTSYFDIFSEVHSSSQTHPVQSEESSHIYSSFHEISSQIYLYSSEASSPVYDTSFSYPAVLSSEIISSQTLPESTEVKSTSREITTSVMSEEHQVPSASMKPMSEFISTSVYTTSSYPTTVASKESFEIFKDCRFLFTFSGDCHLVVNNTLYLAEFIEGLRKTLVDKLYISNDRIKPHDISCGSIKIFVTFKNVSYPKFGDRLKYLVDTRDLVVPTFIESEVLTFTALSVVEVALPIGDIDTLDLPPSGINNIDIIVIIVASCVCGILVIIGITVCVKECYKRKYAQSFDLLDMPHVNLKLEDFTLTRIPRPKTTYNSDNVTANPYADPFHQQPNKENVRTSNGHHVSNGTHIDLKDVHVRMQPLKNEGIIVGVTGYSSSNGAPRKKKRAPSASSRLSSEDRLNGDPSTESLVPENNLSSIGASNPVFIDDDQGSTSTLDVTRNNQMNI